MYIYLLWVVYQSHGFHIQKRKHVICTFFFKEFASTLKSNPKETLNIFVNEMSRIYISYMKKLVAFYYYRKKWRQGSPWTTEVTKDMRKREKKKDKEDELLRASFSECIIYHNVWLLNGIQKLHIHTEKWNKYSIMKASCILNIWLLPCSLRFSEHHQLLSICIISIFAFPLPSLSNIVPKQLANSQISILSHSNISNIFQNETALLFQTQETYSCLHLLSTSTYCTHHHSYMTLFLIPLLIQLMELRHVDKVTVPTSSHGP